MRVSIKPVASALIALALSCDLVAADKFETVREPDAGSILSTLRVASVVPRPLQLRYREIRDGKLLLVFDRLPKRQFTFGLLDQALDKYPDSLGVGDRIPRTSLVITRITPKSMVNSRGVLVDQSEIAIRNTKTGVETVLLPNRIVPAPEIIAHLESVDGRVRFELQAREKFEYPRNSGTTCEVVEVKPPRTVIARNGKGEVFKLRPRDSH
jgi:hypothetical protein